MIPMRQDIVDRAILLTQSHRLRGYDAVQLATALSVQQILQISGLSLTFVASDQDLLHAAQAEGLASDDPLQHL
jgi:uncharacterized protein